MEKVKIKKILNIAVNVLIWSVLALSVLLMIFVAIIKFSGNKSTFLGLGFYQIVSGSMSPEIEVNDVIIAVKSDGSNAQIGDNLVFNYQGKIVTHKLIAKAENGSFIMHGIANPQGSNEYILASDIIAKHTLTLHGFGVAIEFLRSPFGFFLVIFVPITALIIYQTVSLTKRLKEYKNAKEMPSEPQADGENSDEGK